MASASRRFNGRERAALYLLAGGNCSSCGDSLDRGWHADHVIPFSKGGSTDVLNGQALCPTCNLSKGAGILKPWPEKKRLRRWQLRAMLAFKESRDKNFLVVATPGAGKTTFSLRVLHDAISSGAIARVIVVVPSANLKTQWSEEAGKVGLLLRDDFLNENATIAKDDHGVVVTYAQVASAPHVFRSLTNVPTLVVLDEVHHGSDDKTWGKAARMAFEACPRRLLLSGTPFRSDNEAIPFVNYVEGRSQADFVYGYGDALADKVCRCVIFPTYEGEMWWYSRGRDNRAKFRDDVPDYVAAQRLRASLAPDGEFMQSMIAGAVSKLEDIREEQPDAGGLIVASDAFKAKAYMKILQNLTGEVPTLVTYEEEKPNEKLATYKDGKSRWIVAVKMVSEGVDVPRLRVVVYATNIITEMFFRQVVGRIVRVQPGREDDHGFFFFPADATLKEFAADIMEERQHQLDQEIEDVMRRMDEEDGEANECEDKLLNDFVVGGTTGELDDIIVNGQVIGSEEISRAEQICRELGLPKTYDPAIMAKAFRKATGYVPAPQPRPGRDADDDDTPNPKKLKVDLKRALRRLVNLYVARSEGNYSHQDAYNRLITIDNTTMNDITNDQLKQRIQIVSDWLGGRRHAG